MDISLRRNKSSAGRDDKFSFPVIIPTGHDDNEFGFGSPNSPADHLFFNGKLLPHVFPTPQTPNHNFSFSRSASRTSSSMMSSRSNSTNSRSSNCSSARTSTSTDAPSSSSERRLSSNRLRKERSVVDRPVMGPHQCAQVYGSCQRWQLIAAVPVPKRQGSRPSRKVDILDRKMSKKSSPVEVEEEEPGGPKASTWFGGRILKSFVSACKECHAIKT